MEYPVSGDHWYFEGTLWEVREVLKVHNGSTGVFLREVMTGRPYPVEINSLLKHGSLFHRLILEDL